MSALYAKALPLLWARGVLLLILSGFTVALAQGTLLDEINASVVSGCTSGRAVPAPLRRSRLLEEAARGMSRGQEPADALAAAGYRALRSATLFLSNTRSDAEAARQIGEWVCGELRGASAREIGVNRRGRDIWVVVARPFDVGSLARAEEVSQRALRLSNQARASSRRCGARSFPAAPALVLSNLLGEAASV